MAPAGDEVTDGPLSAYPRLIGEREGSNNLAELWGPAILIQLLTGMRPRRAVPVFIDSQLTIDICLHKSRPTANKLAACTRSQKVVRTRRGKNAVFI